MRAQSGYPDFGSFILQAEQPQRRQILLATKPSHSGAIALTEPAGTLRKRLAEAEADPDADADAD